MRQADVRRVGTRPAEAAEPAVPAIRDPGARQPLLERLAAYVGVAPAAGRDPHVDDERDAALGEHALERRLAERAMPDGEQRPLAAAQPQPMVSAAARP